MARRSRRRRNPRGDFMKRAAAYRRKHPGLSMAQAAQALAGKKVTKKAGGRRKKATKKAAGRRVASRRTKVKNRKWAIRKGKKAYLPFLSRKTKRFSPLVKERLVLLGAARRDGDKVVLNPRRRRGKRRNPGISVAGIRRYGSNPRRRRGKRRNPVSVRGGVSAVKGSIKSVFSKRTVVIGASAAAGMVLARLAPALVARIPVVGGLSNMLGRFRDPVVAALAVAIGAQIARKVKLPILEVGPMVAGGLGVAALDGAKVLGLTRFIPGSGSASSGVAGLSDIVSPSQLVNQEAIYGGMGDYLTLSGPVPEQYFAGGLNDYVDFTSPAAGAAASAASFAQTSWSPGAEGFTAGGN